MRTKSILVVVMALASISNAVPVEWPVSSGGNGHFYEPIIVPGGTTWSQANTSANAAGGYLATITSDDENTFVFNPQIIHWLK